MSMDDHKQLIGIPSTHKLVETQPSKWEARKGLDTDTWWYDHVDDEGNLVTKYIVTDSTMIHPPHTRRVSFEKVE